MDTASGNLARALQQGLTLLRLLDDGEPQHLEQLHRGAGLAKSSCLRLLETLQYEGLVERDPQTKAYRALMRLAPLLYGRSVEREIRHRVELLSRESGLTAEWWAPRPEGMCLVARRAPPDQELHINARIGFVYPRDRLEVIPALEHACRLGDGFPEGTIAWQPDGREYVSSAVERKQVIAWAGSGRSHDRIANMNGVRRLAGIVGRGCLALAVPPRPPVEDIDLTYGVVFDEHLAALRALLDEE